MRTKKEENISFQIKIDKNVTNKSSINKQLRQLILISNDLASFHIQLVMFYLVDINQDKNHALTFHILYDTY